MNNALASIEWKIINRLKLSEARNRIIGHSYENILKVVSLFISVPKPTVIVGKDASVNICDTIDHFGVKKILIVTDKALYEMGILKGILAKLEDLKIECAIFSDVLPDPTFAIVENGLAKYKQSNCDSVLAVGGGSTIDTAKVIALAAANEVQPKALVGILKGKKPAVPFFAIPTTAGTGSEATLGAIIADNATHLKEMVLDSKMVPLVAALDPAIMAGLPPHITAACGMDTLTHAIEAYISRVENPDAEHYARSAIKLVFKHLQTAYENGSDLTAREGMALASFYGGLALNGAGLGYVHAFAHPIGAKYKIPHGEANAKLLPYILEYNKPCTTESLAELAMLLSVANSSDTDEQKSQKFIDAVEQLTKSVGIETKVKQLEKNDYDDIIQAAFKEANVAYAVPKYMSYESAIAILDKASA